MTTWGDLAAGDRIRDKNGHEWKVQSIDGARFLIQDGSRSVPVTPVLTSEVERISDKSPVDYLDEDRSVIEDAFGADKVELVASETTEEREARQAATDEHPLVLPPIESPHTLRSHLYLVHSMYVADISNRAALLEHHRKSHELNQGTPHTHEEST